MSEEEEYGLSPEKESRAIKPPPVNYLPPRPREYNPGIALIGTGGISEFHLKNYQTCGYRVVALSNRTPAKAEAMRDKFYPDATVHKDYREILVREDVDVVDVTPHPADRLPILFDCLQAGKHVLSQKPFVLDLEEGKKLVDLADEKGLKLAVNQNGRWAPHFSYLRNAISSGLIGEVTSIDFSLQWDQTWVQGIPSFEEMDHLVLFDFAIHWFDIASCLMAGHEPKKVYASAVRHSAQVYKPPALASAIIDYPDAQVRMSFNAHCTLGEEDVTTVVGSKGTLRSRGPGLNDQPKMEVHLEDGSVEVPLQGSWFDSGFQGTMGELLRAIEEDREPIHSARQNLRSLKLGFTALESADSGQAVIMG